MQVPKYLPERKQRAYEEEQARLAAETGCPPGADDYLLSVSGSAYVSGSACA